LLFVFAKHNKPRFGGVCYLARYRYNARLPKLADLLDSRRDATNNGLVAQSVEQRIENPCVGGSIPPRATKKQGVARCAAPFLFQPVNKLSTSLGSLLIFTPSEIPGRGV
jgi:hypothetical protein